MIVIRVGLGQTPSGKILDRGTQAYRIVEFQNALQFANDTGRKMFVSFNKQKYVEVDAARLLKIVTEYYEKQYLEIKKRFDGKPYDKVKEIIERETDKFSYGSESSNTILDVNYKDILFTCINGDLQIFADNRNNVCTVSPSYEWYCNGIHIYNATYRGDK